jgi:chloramphenicol 3-O-phosphotransferase
VTEQNTDIIVALTRTSAAFASRGYDVILDGLFVPQFLPVIASELRSTGLAVHYVVLQAPLEMALRRVQDRIGHERDHVVRLMHDAFCDLGVYGSHVVDTGSGDAETVAAELGQLLDRAKFVFDLR